MKKTNSLDHTPVKLHADHQDHLMVLSAHMQDAVVTAGTMTHSPEKKTFKLMGNRFCWERFLNPDNPIKLRVHAGLHFDHVKSVHKKNIHTHHPDKLYNLMAIQAQPNEITLSFSEHAEIKLHVDKVSCKLADLHEPYPTQFLPTHTHQG